MLRIHGAGGAETYVASCAFVPIDPILDDGTPAAEFEITAQADEKQQRALDLLKGIGELSMPAPRL